MIEAAILFGALLAISVVFATIELYVERRKMKKEAGR